ncbi:MAG TPA: hypothetical protein VF796_15665 [Humisphaera sp.]
MPAVRAEPLENCRLLGAGALDLSIRVAGLTRSYAAENSGDVRCVVGEVPHGSAGS